MIDLAEVRRVRLKGGTRIHSTNRTRAGLFTACGQIVKVAGPTGRTYDEPQEDSADVSCAACARELKREAPDE